MTLPPTIAAEILTSSADAVVVVDAAGTIVFVNNRAEELFGYDAGDLVGSDVEVLMPEAMRDTHAMHRKGFVKTPHPRPLVSGLTLKGMRKDGEVFDAEIALMPIETEQGLIVSSTIRDRTSDITSDTYFRNLLETAPDAMIIVDQEGRISIINGQAEKMFGYSRSELLGGKSRNCCLTGYANATCNIARPISPTRSSARWARTWNSPDSGGMARCSRSRSA